MDEVQQRNEWMEMQCMHGATPAQCASSDLEDNPCLKENCPSGSYTGAGCQFFWNKKLPNGKNVYGVPLK